MYIILMNRNIRIVYRKCNVYKLCFYHRTSHIAKLQNHNEDTYRSTDMQMDKRKGFGSFHSEDIEVLIKQPLSNDDYTSVIPYDIQQQHQDSLDYATLTYGQQMKESLFMLDPQYNFLNHGAFGNTLIPVLKESHVWSTYCEKQPLRFFDRQLLPLLSYTLKHIANFVHCPASELYPLQNVTQGLNCILHSLKLYPEDEVVCFSLTYGSTKKMLQDICTRSQATLHIIDISIPIQDEVNDIIEKYAQYINKNTKLVIIDHITSNTAIQLPIIQLAQIAKAVNSLVIIDAAHTMLSLPVHIYTSTTSTTTLPTDHLSQTLCSSSPNTSAAASLALCISDVADVWITNGHKWLCAPKGCAVMWVHPSIARHLRPPIISHGFTLGSVDNVSLEANSRWWHGYSDTDIFRENKLLSSLVWNGCRDYSAFLCLPSALRIWSSMPRHNSCAINTTATTTKTIVNKDSYNGIDGVRSYIKSLLKEQICMLMHEWKVDEDDFIAPYYMREHCPMILMPLPSKVAGIYTRNNLNTDQQAYYLQERLHHNYAIEVPIKCISGNLYVRISAHVYNTPEQYSQLAYVINHM